MKRNPSLKEMEAFAKKARTKLVELKERHSFCHIRYEFTAYPSHAKGGYCLNWGMDNTVHDFKTWNDLTAYVEMSLEARDA